MEFDVALADDVCQGVDHDRVGLKQSRKCIDRVDRYCAAGKAIGPGSHLVLVTIELCIGACRYQYIPCSENPGARLKLDLIYGTDIGSRVSNGDCRSTISIDIGIGIHIARATCRNKDDSGCGKHRTGTHVDFCQIGTRS